MQIQWSSLIPPDLGDQLQTTLTSVSEGLILFLISAGVFLLGWLLATVLSRLVQGFFAMVGVDASYARLQRSKTSAVRASDPREAGASRAARARARRQVPGRYR